MENLTGYQGQGVEGEPMPGVGCSTQEKAANAVVISGFSEEDKFALNADDWTRPIVIGSRRFALVAERFRRDYEIPSGFCYTDISDAESDCDGVEHKLFYRRLLESTLVVAMGEATENGVALGLSTSAEAEVARLSGIKVIKFGVTGQDMQIPPQEEHVKHRTVAVDYPCKRYSIVVMRQFVERILKTSRHQLSVIDCTKARTRGFLEANDFRRHKVDLLVTFGERKFRESEHYKKITYDKRSEARRQCAANAGVALLGIADAGNGIIIADDFDLFHEQIGSQRVYCPSNRSRFPIGWSVGFINPKDFERIKREHASRIGGNDE